MASEGEGKPKQNGWVLRMLPLLRLVAFTATVSATLVMALNKQTKTLAVATNGNTPMSATLIAKFQHTPAFVFFVVANGLASLHNLLMIAMDFVGQKFDPKGHVSALMIPVLDMMTVALAAGGTNAAAFMAELGRNGNSHARWDKICDKFERFCDNGGGAIAASFVGLLLLMIINVISIIKLQNHYSISCSAVP